MGNEKRVRRYEHAGEYPKQGAEHDEGGQRRDANPSEEERRRRDYAGKQDQRRSKSRGEHG